MKTSRIYFVKSEKSFFTDKKFLWSLRTLKTTTIINSRLRTDLRSALTSIWFCWWLPLFVYGIFRCTILEIVYRCRNEMEIFRILSYSSIVIATEWKSQSPEIMQHILLTIFERFYHRRWLSTAIKNNKNTRGLEISYSSCGGKKRALKSRIQEARRGSSEGK